MPNNNCENRLLSLLSAQEWHLDRLYAEYSRNFGTIFRNYNGRMTDARKKQLQKALQGFNDDLEKTFAAQINNSFSISNLCNDDLAKSYLKGLETPEKILNKVFTTNPGAVQSFLARTAGGLTLSDRVWALTNQTQEALESVLESGVLNGRSAAEMATDLKKYLKEPDRQFRRIRDKNGKLILSNPAKDYHPGRGVYRSSYKNALRLSRNEVNIAYRTNDFERRKNMPFVMGQRVELSSAHPAYDICDELRGTYPKEFKFIGWHTNCYDEQTEVLTKDGWKFFKDLLKEDQIFSLNPETRVPEYVGFKHYIKKPFKGDMISFKNRSLDMLVTPDHPMKYINKGNGRTIEECTAKDYRSTKGALYRSSEYEGQDIDFITIGEHEINFDLFAEFMAYYLSEGSLSWTRKNQFHIAQCEEKHNEQYLLIKALLEKLPFKFSEVKTGFYLRDEAMYNYLKQFGKSKDKHVPDVILNSSKRQIEIFLQGYVICDGYTRLGKSFVGNRGTTFTPKQKERSFFTSSELMASNIGEMLVKIGKRPSYRVQKAEGKLMKHKNGEYKSNKDIIRITECHSQTATVFEKGLVPYDGFVYDVELERNHILYIRRNGKTVWGSNCLCFTTSLLLPRDKFKEYLGGGQIDNRHVIKTIPKNAMDYLNNNAETLKGYKNKPYFLQDNFKNTKEGFALKAGI